MKSQILWTTSELLESNSLFTPTKVHLLCEIYTPLQRRAVSWKDFAPSREQNAALEKTEKRIFPESVSWFDKNQTSFYQFYIISLVY